MSSCPIEVCGRKFEDQPTMLEHIRRRHPENLQQIKNQLSAKTFSEQHVMQEEINKLPKLNTLKEKSKQRKNIEFHRRSISKGKKEQTHTIINTSKVSSIISQSRQMAQSSENNSKNTKRASLTRKNSANLLEVNREDKLPDIMMKQNKQKKLEIIKPSMNQTFTHQFKDVQHKTNITHDNQELFYTTAPNFKKLEVKKIHSLKSSSKSKEKDQDEKMQKISSNQGLAASKKELLKRKLDISNKNLLLRTPHSQEEKEKEESTHKTLNKPLKRFLEKQQNNTIEEDKPKLKENTMKIISIRQKQSINNQEQIRKEYNFQQKVVVLKKDIVSKLNLPEESRAQILFANNCGIKSINFRGNEYLRELSLQHNELASINFLNYSHSNIQKLYLDHNKISIVDYLPERVRVLSLSFNLISNVESTTKELLKCKAIQELDLTFNPLRKQSNYKLQIINACKHVKKVDGMKITKIDLELAYQYARLMDQHYDLVASSKQIDVSSNKLRPSTAVSNYDNELEEQEVDEGLGKSEGELQKDIKRLQKIIKQTTDHMKILQQENSIIDLEIKELHLSDHEQDEDVTLIYQKLKRECEALELLNFLQYADQSELEQIIHKKQRQLS